MPRRGHWSGQRKNHYATPRWQHLEPIAQAPFTPRQVLGKRLELAQEMVELILQDGQDLAAPQRRTLQRLCAALAVLRRQAGEQG